MENINRMSRDEKDALELWNIAARLVALADMYSDETLDLTIALLERDCMHLFGDELEAHWKIIEALQISKVTRRESKLFPK